MDALYSAEWMATNHNDNIMVSFEYKAAIRPIGTSLGGLV